MAKKSVSLEAITAATPEPAKPIRSSASRKPMPLKIKGEVEKLTVYVPKAAAKRLKLMALERDRKVNDFLQEGVNMMLKKYGQPLLAEYEDEGSE